MGEGASQCEWCFPGWCPCYKHSIREQMGKDMGNMPVNSTGLGNNSFLQDYSLLEFLSDFLLWWTDQWKCKVNIPFPSLLAFWSWYFIAVMETLRPWDKNQRKQILNQLPWISYRGESLLWKWNVIWIKMIDRWYIMIQNI